MIRTAAVVLLLAAAAVAQSKSIVLVDGQRIAISDIGTANPANGCVPVDKAFMKSIKKGMVYVNVHTTANPGGEIRGQLMKLTPTYKIKSTPDA